MKWNTNLRVRVYGNKLRVEGDGYNSGELEFRPDYPRVTFYPDNVIGELVLAIREDTIEVTRDNRFCGNFALTEHTHAGFSEAQIIIECYVPG